MGERGDQGRKEGNVQTAPRCVRGGGDCGVGGVGMSAHVISCAGRDGGREDRAVAMVCVQAGLDACLCM